MQKATIFRGLNKKWYYRIHAGNGEPIASSEPYFSKWNAKRAVKKNFPSVAEIKVIKP